MNTSKTTPPQRIPAWLRNWGKREWVTFLGTGVFTFVFMFFFMTFISPMAAKEPVTQSDIWEGLLVWGLFGVFQGILFVWIFRKR